MKNTISTWNQLNTGLIAIALVSFSCLPAESKKWSIDDRQTKLMQEINEGQKSKELTLKEANKLRKDLSNVARHQAKMKNKSTSNRTLSADQASEMESQINKISSEMHKCKLDKRTESH